MLGEKPDHKTTCTVTPCELTNNKIYGHISKEYVYRDVHQRVHSFFLMAGFGVTWPSCFPCWTMWRGGWGEESTLPQASWLHGKSSSMEHSPASSLTPTPTAQGVVYLILGASVWPPMTQGTAFRGSSRRSVWQHQWPSLSGMSNSGTMCQQHTWVGDLNSVCWWAFHVLIHSRNSHWTPDIVP